MMIFKTIHEITKKLDELRSENKSVGFVPTMGALHQGHLSLVEKAANENDVVVTSIFVNPAQFNNPDDLRNYPRNINADLKLLEKTNCKIVFAPSEQEIYPDEATKKNEFEFGYLTKVMEGKYRPGHFDGVALVVKRLFEIVRPARAYFGQKDIQQFLIINFLNKNYLSHLQIELVKCPIIRESDGLAMSSRNVLLNSDQRRSAALISKGLFEAGSIYKNYTPAKLRDLTAEKINADKNLKVEYLEFITDPDLISIEKWDDQKKILACIAVQVGNVRLIDNIYFN